MGLSQAKFFDGTKGWECQSFFPSYDVCQKKKLQDKPPQKSFVNFESFQIEACETSKSKWE